LILGSPWYGGEEWGEESVWRVGWELTVADATGGRCFEFEFEVNIAWTVRCGVVKAKTAESLSWKLASNFWCFKWDLWDPAFFFLLPITRRKPGFNQTKEWREWTVTEITKQNAAHSVWLLFALQCGFCLPCVYLWHLLGSLFPFLFRF
jgi:hypothetical protein